MPGRVERKVAWSSIATYIASAAGLAALQAVGDTQLIEALPDPAEPFALALLPLAATFVAGYKARHTPRPDLWDDEPGDHVAGPGRPAFDPDSVQD
ncbi:hypothetical protein [Pseudonocardia parietis]|uniref:Holin n=1 Tax=Pseudonocardia parietis TaxID=570936 RepID=A0ABS4W2F2_9PSEU|nr:hypothetical protein [Pseudonocardia parietis]MBP2370196.1 hypothetical protein [Pseudonocardia parietis]